MSSGSNNSAQKAAQRQEEARQAAIRSTQSQINSVFDNPQRAADISQAVGAQRTLLLGDLDQQKMDADRMLKFALARGGLTGGSTQVDQQTRLGKDYQRGVLHADAQARGLGADIEAADQDSRARLTQQAAAGLDITTAAQQSAAAMRTALEANKAASQAQGLSDVFGQFSKFYQRSEDAKAMRRADLAAGIGYYGAAAQPTGAFGW
jgi:hypothetical protein